VSLDPARRLGLSRHADLKSRDGDFVLVLPERALRLGGSGAEILRVISEERTIGAILQTMRERYADTPDIESEVLGFLDEMLKLGGIVPIDPAEATNGSSPAPVGSDSNGAAGADRTTPMGAKS